MVSIRPARIGDSRFVAPLVYSSAVLEHDFMLKTPTKNAIDFLEFAFREDAGFWGYTLALVLEEEGQVAATIASYPWTVKWARVWSGFVAVFRFYGFREGLGVFLRSAKIGLRFKPIPEKGIYVANLATEERFRGRGFASLLYNYVHDYWRTRGMAIAVCDVGDWNHGSRRILDRLGYKISASNPQQAENWRMELKL